MAQDTGLHRNRLDKFYTRPEVVSECIRVWKEQLHPSVEDTIIEPSAGNGSFLLPLRREYTVLGYDIEPEHEWIVRQDFLTLSPPSTPHSIHIIGNPPFGRQSSLAIQFIRKAATFADTISFILPKSFKKESLHAKIPRMFHLRYEMDVPDHSFMIGTKSYHVPCVFQIWIRSSRVLRELIPVLEYTEFEFVYKHQSPELFAVRRVGVNAGRITTEIEDASIETHYFLRFLPPYTIASLPKLQFTFSHDNTVGPRSISKPELIREIKRCLAQ